MRKYNPTNSRVSIDENGRVSFTTQSLQEARITIHGAMFNFLNKEIKQLMKKHNAYVNKGESDKTFTVISTPSSGFEKDYSALMKKHKKKIIQHFKLESVDITMPVVTTEDVQEDGPCWPGYKQVGTKMKNGKEVPNCVPIDEYNEKVNLQKALKKVKGLTKQQAQVLMTMPPSVLTSMINQLGMLVNSVEEENVEEKVLYKSPTGWRFELFGGKVVMIGKNSGRLEIPQKDFKILQRIIGQVKV